MSNQWRFTTNEAGQVVLQVRRPETNIYKMSHNLADWEDAKVTDLDIMGALMGRVEPVRDGTGPMVDLTFNGDYKDADNRWVK